MSLGALLDLLVPPACAACGAPPPWGTATRGGPLCAGCRRELTFLTGPRCARCGLPEPCGRGRCPAAGAPFSASWAPVAYAGAAERVVHGLKGRARMALAPVMAAQIVAGAPPGLLGAGGVLVPVPTHPARRRERGFDQAEVLARALGRRTGLPVRAGLRRRGAVTRQAGASRAERLAEGRLMLRWRGSPPVRAVLVDDVHTTGATLSAAALAMLSAGSRDVVAVSWARTVPSASTVRPKP